MRIEPAKGYSISLIKRSEIVIRTASIATIPMCAVLFCSPKSRQKPTVIAAKVDDVSRLYAAAALGHQRPFLGYDGVRIFQGQALDGGAFRHRQAARYPVD